jgi:hypothetical protein
MKTNNCKVAIVFVALAFPPLFPTPSHAQHKPQKAAALTMDDILACVHSPAMRFLKRSMDQIRATSTGAEGQTSYYDRQVEIHWSDTGDTADILSLTERKFCSLGHLNSWSCQRASNLSDTLALFIGTPVIPTA